MNEDYVCMYVCMYVCVIYMYGGRKSSFSYRTSNSVAIVPVPVGPLSNFDTLLLGLLGRGRLE